MLASIYKSLKALVLLDNRTRPTAKSAIGCAATRCLIRAKNNGTLSAP